MAFRFWSLRRVRLGRFPLLALIGGSVAGLILGAAYLAMLHKQATAKPTFIDDLVGRRLAAKDIERVDILKYAGGPCGEWDLAKKASTSVTSRGAIEELVQILRAHTTPGGVWRNHPDCFYEGLMRIVFVNDSSCYVHYLLCKYEGHYYTMLGAASAGEGAAKTRGNYENLPLAAFLKAHDPWYLDEHSPPSEYLPNYPDTVP